ncbi:hypothetical protein SDC9_169663 [bioreactor metagenome]|uniref:Uncharacterized protein n=1 Tax=bioreactor metagenome TaxID=1076179 RepID=A0A645G8G1_9ZZZZ
MPCFEPEIREAEEEGVEIIVLRNPVRYLGEDGRVTKVELTKMQLG